MNVIPRKPKDQFVFEMCGGVGSTVGGHTGWQLL